MKRINLYAHYDSVTNHVMTRGITLTYADMLLTSVPENLILAEAPPDFGRFDAQTNFKVLRGQEEVIDYIQTCEAKKIRMSNWIDFESIELMHQLMPNEIAELLYLFHAHVSLRSAFFYKLQNDYVFLTLSNGLQKTYYRHVSYFYPRFKRVIQERMTDLLNEGRMVFFARKELASPLNDAIIEELAPLFVNGMKIDFLQAYQEGATWIVPLYIIEDELTLLTQNQPLNDRVGALRYDTVGQQWLLELDI